MITCISIEWEPVIFNSLNTPFHRPDNAQREKSFQVLYTLEASFSPRKESVYNASHVPNAKTFYSSINVK